MSLQEEVGTEAPPSPGPADGRLLRSERTKEAITDALLDLVREGNRRPSSAQIAARAGVTQRTLFNQFGDMESLFGAVADRQGQRIAKLLPTGGTGTVQQRAERFSTELSLLLEETMNLRWAVLTHPTGSEHFGDGIDKVRDVMRTRIREAFQDEIDPKPEVEQLQMLDMIEIEADPITWRLRRLQQGLSVTQAAEHVRRVLLAIVAPVS